MSADQYADALAAIEARRALIEAGTPGPWRVGDDQLIAGVMDCFGAGRCAYCHLGEPVWVGRRDINGETMQAHVHIGTPLDENGIYAERPDGNLLIMASEYGPVDVGADAALIVAAVNAFARDTDALAGVLEQHKPDPEPIELTLHMDEPCEVCETDGHSCIVCAGCYPVWDDMTAHCIWPCADARAALTALGVEA